MGVLKRKVGNKARVESSICNAYLMEEIADFCVNYFDESVDTKTRDSGRNVTICDHMESNPNIPDLFSLNVGYAPSEGTRRYLDEREFRVAHGYVLSNCEILKPFERYVSILSVSNLTSMCIYLLIPIFALCIVFLKKRWYD